MVRLYRDANPDRVINLAAEVGGISANKANPRRDQDRLPRNNVATKSWQTGHRWAQAEHASLS